MGWQPADIARISPKPERPTPVCAPADGTALPQGGMEDHRNYNITLCFYLNFKSWQD
jgi:hypothetical protein